MALRLLPHDDDLGGIRPRLVGEGVLGYEPEGYQDSCWLLHTIWVDGQRVFWKEALSGVGRRLEDWRYTLSFRMFSGVNLPPGHGPSLGEIDRITLDALVEVLSRHSPGGPGTECRWAQAWIEDLSKDTVVAHAGPLSEALHRFDLCSGPQQAVSNQFPAQWWPIDQSWYVLTNWDLSATEVFGSPELIAELLADETLEAVRHPTLAEWDARSDSGTYWYELDDGTSATARGVEER